MIIRSSTDIVEKNLYKLYNMDMNIVFQNCAGVTNYHLSDTGAL